MSATPSPVDSVSTAASSFGPTPGLLFVVASVMKKPGLDAKLLDAWYDEHMDDILQCPGNGGLFLRYKNADPTADDFFDPKLAERTSPETTLESIAHADWPYLAMVKLSDLNWMLTEQFDALPRVSKLLPLEADGSIGSAFSCWHAGLRTYETVSKIPDPTGSTTRAKYVLSIQTADIQEATLEALDKHYATLPGFRGAIRYKNVNGIAQFQEPGTLPGGLVVYEFDGDAAPVIVAEKIQIRADVWGLTHEAGDRSLRL